MNGVALVALLLCAGPVAAAEPDPWFGADKGLHFGFSAALAIGGYGASATFLETPKARLAYGASVALLAGIGKELWDASGNGNASLKDLTWDVLGAAVGVAICWAIDELFFHPGSRTGGRPSTAQQWLQRFEPALAELR